MTDKFHSKAQIRKFFDLHKQGKIGLDVIAHRALHTNHKDLPEHVDD